MARELTAGYALVAQISEKVISEIFAKGFLERMPTATGSVADRTVDVWFDTPSTELSASNDPQRTILEVRLPFTGRTSDLWDECQGTLTVRPSVIQVKVTDKGQTLIAPALDLRNAAPDTFSLTVDNAAFRQPVEAALVQALRAQAPITVGPLLPDTGRPVFFRSFTGARTTNGDVLGIFISDKKPSPPLPQTAKNLARDGIVVLVPRDTVHANIGAALAAQGLGRLPAGIPGHDGLTLTKLTIELQSDHFFITGSAEKNVLGPLSATVNFKVWMRLWVNEDGSIRVEIPRTDQDAGFLGDFLDLFSGGAVTRALEDAIPGAIRSAVGDSAFGDLSVFAPELSAAQRFAAARTYGRLLIMPEGLGIPVALVRTPWPPTQDPPYIRGHLWSREFHVRGCKYGDQMSAKNARRFVTWQAAVAAGYNGCATCQPEFNVGEFGELFVTFVGPVGTLPAPSVKATYAGTTTRFGVPVGRLEEKNDRPIAQVVNNQVEVLEQLRSLVPGVWDVTLAWGDWSVSGPVEVQRRWVYADGRPGRISHDRAHRARGIDVRGRA